MIYFIACGDLVKIGTASNARTRRAGLQTGNPTPITLLGEIPGGKTVESDLHRQFYALRVRGEWFRYEGELRAFIERAIAAPEAVGDTAVPYCLFDSDSAFFGVFDTSGHVCRAYTQACRAVIYSSVGQWWRFEADTTPTGHVGMPPYPLREKTVSCALRDASGFKCEETQVALARLLRKAKEFRS